MTVSESNNFYQAFNMTLLNTAITCPPLNDLTNGTVTYNDVEDESGNLNFETQSTYSCDTGFFLVGINTRTCTGDGSSITGSFDGEAPTCEGDRVYEKCCYTCTPSLYIQSLLALP